MTVFNLLNFIIVCSVYGQHEDYNIYQTGKSLTSCECNFKNLFDNWGPRFITTYDSISLISWNYVETLKDTSRVNFYVRKYMNPQQVYFNYSKNYMEHLDESNTVTRHYERKIKPNRIEIPTGMETEYLYYMREMQEAFREIVKINDKVYTVTLEYSSVLYTIDAYCRPEENEVYFDYASFYQMTAIPEIDKQKY